MSRELTKVVVLAAGKGTRMKSERAKVMHEVFFAPMLHHVLAALEPLNLLRDTVVVTGHQADGVETSLVDFPVSFARQAQQLGTANAVLSARAFYEDFTGTVLILCGDTPLVSSEILGKMLDDHRNSGACLTVMTTMMENPTNYGRIISDSNGEVACIVEEKDASAEEKAIREVNAGIYCVDAQFLCEGLQAVNNNNNQREFYLTDLIAIARGGGQRVARCLCPDSLEVLGINSRVELAEAHRELKRRRNRKLMFEGVTIVAPESVEIADGVSIDQDTVIEHGVKIFGSGKVGRACHVGPQVVLHNCVIGDEVCIAPFCFLEGCEVPSGQNVPAGTVWRGASVRQTT